MQALPIDPARMLDDLDRLRRIGAVGLGVARRAFDDHDIAARRWLAQATEAAGLRAIADPEGNLWGLPPGDGKALLIGSHSDTQPLGGWLDGIYGVACGLEIARATRAAGGPPVAVVSFQDEEGRFGGLTGSAVWSGAMTREAADGLHDADGTSWAVARRRAAEIAPPGEAPPARFHAYLEPHIEQGPVLDTAGEVLGVVEAIVGVRQAQVTFTGEANHAGTTPMHLRRDAVRGVIALATALDTALGEIADPRTVWTLGRITVEPNAPSIVPGRASVTVQMRDADTRRLRAMVEALHASVARVAAAQGLGADLAEGFTLDPVQMDDRLMSALADGAAATCPGKWRRMPSGALHDASHVARVVPSGMLFVPSIGGISHNPDEDTRRAHLEAGLAALAHAARALAP
jgi:N-carbamoyl-L-amino-acid hydrolase